MIPCTLDSTNRFGKPCRTDAADKGGGGSVSDEKEVTLHTSASESCGDLLDFASLILHL